MPFVKLDCGIIDSTVWAEPAETSKCWITMLAMADANGLVRSTIPGIANRSRLSIRATTKAVQTFESPDEHSRSLNDEGKRINRVDGGYQIINYEAYRKKDHTAAERMRRMRAKPVTRNKSVTPVTKRNVTQAEAEADKKDIGANGSRPTSKNGLVDSEWLERIKQAQAYKGIDVDIELSKMAQWCIVNGKTPTRRRLINWLNRTDKPILARSPRRTNQPPKPQPAGWLAWLRDKYPNAGTKDYWRVPDSVREEFKAASK